MAVEWKIKAREYANCNCSYGCPCQFNDIPHGFEYRLAEIGSGRTTTWGKIKLDFKNTYGQFARIFLSNKGVYVP